MLLLALAAPSRAAAVVVGVAGEVGAAAAAAAVLALSESVPLFSSVQLLQPAKDIM